jgi:hypothetical protein
VHLPLRMLCPSLTVSPACTSTVSKLCRCALVRSSSSDEAMAQFAAPNGGVLLLLLCCCGCWLLERYGESGCPERAVLCRSIMLLEMEDACLLLPPSRSAFRSSGSYPKDGGGQAGGPGHRVDYESRLAPSIHSIAPQIVVRTRSDRRKRLIALLSSKPRISSSSHNDHHQPGERRGGGCH